MNSPRMLWQVEAKAAEVLTQQMLDRFERQTFDADEVTARLADLAEVLIPAS